MAYFNYNGKIHKAGSTVIGVSNRGLRYGDGLFETIKCINGQLVMPDEHFSRLWKGMSILDFEIPRHFTPTGLEEEIISLAMKNSHEKAARIRLTVIRGDGGLYDAVSLAPNYIIETWALPESNGNALNSNGLVLGIYHQVKKNAGILSNLKHNNYLHAVMASIHAKKNKWNDAILLNSEGSVCESTIANVFVVKNGSVYTPSLDEGCVAGVMRKAVLKHLLSNSQSTEIIDITEKQVTLDDLMQADEVFLTNSIYDIRWVQSIEEKKYGNAITQQIHHSLIHHFNDKVIIS